MINFFNGNQTRNWSELINPIMDRNRRFVRRIKITEINDELKRMKTGKFVGHDEIPIEVWKCLGDMGIEMVDKPFQ